MLILAAIAAAAALSAPAAAPRIPYSAIYLVPVTPQDARRYADALVQLAARVGLSPGAVGSEGFEKAVSRIGPVERDAILARNGLTPAFFGRVGAQVRHNPMLGRIVVEELRLAARG